MALTQSARIPGPSWEEEVVPALRKRLQSESRTLTHRMSAISLSSAEDATGADYTVDSEQSTSLRYEETRRQEPTSTSRIQKAPTNQPGPVTTANPRVNGTSTSSTNFQRARTYSTPYASDYPDSRVNGTARPKNSASRSPDPNRSLSPRPSDAKPTRIPVATRPPMPSNHQSHGTANATPSAWSPEQASLAGGGKQRTVVPSVSSQSLEISNRGYRQPGLLNEAAPFPTDTTLSSSFSQPTVGSHSTSLDLADPPRASMESEERPYEHWYRGEVSRNGGVGELRVGRRQEMLDIANYGHMVRKMQDKQRLEAAASRNSSTRKRADSIAGITNKVRQRNSLIMEDENAEFYADGAVLDETPLTDMDGEESEAQSGVDQYIGIAYAPEEGDMDASPAQRWTTVAGAHEMARSVTPTQNSISNAGMIPSRSQNIPPTRIPGPSSRRNSYSQANPANASSAAANNSQSQSPSPKQQPARSTPSPQALQKPRQPQSLPGTPQKHRNSPAAQHKAKVAAAKMAKSKTLPAKADSVDKRGSVAYYPTVDGDGDDMADAIPSWTQPVAREGNWDDVVLPVVARKKGLDGYESADGSPKPRRVSNAVEPAPGTFGFDHSKYRPPRGDGVSIPMDEFGRQPNGGANTHDEHVNGSDEFHEMRFNPTTASAHDETQLPARQGHSPSPAPFSDYPPNTIERRAMQSRVEVLEPEAKANMKASQQQQQNGKADEEESGSGCCKCVVM